MQIKNYLRLLLPHFVAIAAFIIVSSIYFLPVFQGNELKQHDIETYRGMSKEIEDFRMVNGEESLWTNGIFGGMPSYAISTNYPSNYLTVVSQILTLGLPKPVGLLFVAMLGFYIFALCLRVNSWLGLLGALAFGLSTINVLYIGAGHITKVLAIAYMAPALGGMILAFRGNWLLGSVIFSLFFGLNIMAGHPQMTYYLAFILFAVAVGEGIRLLKNKEFVSLGKIAGGLSIGVLLGILPNIGYLMVMSEYKPYSTRGNTELTKSVKGTNDEVQKEGLDEDYILEYNYGKGEILSILIPNAKGGNDAAFGEDKKLMSSVDGKYRNQVARWDKYWGGQKMSGGAFYFGVIMFVFFVFGLIFLKDSIKWPFLVIFLLAVLLASNDPGGLNAFFIHKFPLYNAFRDSKMILVLLQIIIPALGILFLDKLIKKEGLYNYRIKSYLIVSGVMVFVTLVLWIAPSLNGSYLNDRDIEQFEGYTAQINEAAKQNPKITEARVQQELDKFDGAQQSIIDARISIYRSDVLRMLLLVLTGCGVVLAFIYFSMSSMAVTITIAAATIFVMADNMSISKRYLNNELAGSKLKSYTPSDKSSTPFLPRPADRFILEREKPIIADFDKKLKDYSGKMDNHVFYKKIKNTALKKELANFGVLNLNSDYRVLSFQNPFNETYTSYFHKSIGGYQGAKMKRYQELIEYYITKEMAEAQNSLFNARIQLSPEIIRQAQTIPEQNINEYYRNYCNNADLDLPPVPMNTPVLNMLNAKYFVNNPVFKPYVNTQANGNAWFVGQVKKVVNSDQEMSELGKIDTKNTLIVNQNEFKEIAGKLKNNYTPDSTATVKLTNYATNVLTYASNSKTEMPVVFSEIYYPEGWNCYIDGNKVEPFRANYVLRALLVPAGKHKIEWKFEPETYAKGNTYALIGSLGLLIALFSILGMNIKEKLKEIDKKA